MITLRLSVDPLAIACEARCDAIFLPLLLLYSVNFNTFLFNFNECFI